MKKTILITVLTLMGLNTAFATFTGNVSGSFVSSTQNQANLLFGWNVHSTTGPFHFWTTSNYVEGFFDIIDSTNNNQILGSQYITYVGNPGDSINLGVAFTLTGLTTGHIYKVVPHITLYQNGIAVWFKNGSALVFQTQCIAPTVTATASVNTICAGTSTTLTAVGGGSYSWNTGQTGSSIVVSPLATASYTVTTTTNGCSSTNNITITVNQAPTVSTSGNISTCNGAPASITASGALTYSWLPATGLNTVVGPNVTATLMSPITYTVTGTSNGCSDTATVMVSMSGVNLAANSVTICSGTSTTLNATGGTAYSWSPTNFLSDPNIGNPIASPHATTTYTVTGMANGCTGTAIITVHVALNTTPVTVSSSVNKVCKDAFDGSTNVTLTGTPAGGSFFVNGNPLIGNIFNGATALAGVNTIKYTYNDVNNCPASASTTILNDSAPIIISTSPLAGTGVVKNFGVHGFFIDNLKAQIVDPSTGNVTIYNALSQSGSFAMFSVEANNGYPVAFMYGNGSVGCFTDFGALGVNELLKNEDVKMFPNPFVDVLHLEVPNGKYQITIVNSIGQVVRSIMEEGSSFEIMRNDLSAGQYLMSISISNGEKTSTISRKLLVE